MRIVRATVDLYGPIEDRVFKFASGLNVFSGPNGCGKTALAEFLAACMVPSAGKAFPERGKDDSGSMTADDDGTEASIRIRGPYRIGRVPECLLSMGPDLYRGVYFIGKDTVEDLSFLESAFAGTKHSTHPELAMASEKAREAAEYALGQELEEIDVLIAETESAAEKLEEEANRFGEYASQAEAIRRMIRMETEDSPEAEELREHTNLRETYRPYYDRLSDLAASRKALESFEWVGRSDVAVYQELVEKLRKATEASESMDEMMYGPLTELGNNGPNDIFAHATEIKKLAEGRESYARNSKELRDRKTELAGAKMGIPKKKTTLFGLGGANKGEALDIPALTRRIDDLTRMTESYEESASSVSFALGIMMTDTEQAVAEMVRMMNAADILSKNGDAMNDSKAKLENAKIALERFLERFGGEKGFAECAKKTEDARDIDSETSEIRRILSEAGLNPDETICATEYLGAAGNVDNLKKRLYYLEGKMARILGSGELESLMDRKSALKAKRDSVIRKGISYALAYAIANRIGEGESAGIRPDLDVASGYLSEMARRECKISWEDGFRISDGGPPQTMASVGSGMRILASISLKLAAAESASSCDIPMILDEPFAGLDTESKSGACRAIRNAARKLQIIVFTCDRETNEIFSSMSGAAIINMGMPHRNGTSHATL